jgi:hypothetical protein
MTDYYPLIARAIAGLDPDAPGESRRALYERARASLIAQLRSVRPPISESEATRERLSLDEAIRKLEAEVAAQDVRVSSNRDGNDYAQGDTDPLAELARLIGQTDPFAALGLGNPPLPSRSVQPEEEDEPAPGPPSWLRRARENQDNFHSESSDQPDLIDPLHRSRNQPPASDPSPRDDSGYGKADEQAPTRGGRAEKPKPKLALPPISTLPEQNENRAIAFRPSRTGPLELSPDSDTDFLDPEQSQLYARMRAQLMKLQEDVPGQERIQIDDVINDFLDQPTSWQAVEFKKVLWLCGNGLRNKLAQHDAVKDDLDPHYNRLPAGVAAALRKPIETWNVFVLGDAELVELDSKRLGPQEQQTAIENINAAKPIVEPAATDRHITTEQAGRVLVATLQAASSPIDNINTKQAQYLAEGTSRNLVVQIVRRAYLFCQNIIDPQTDEARVLVLEYKKGMVKAAGTATFGAAIYYGAPYAASFFEFVARNAEIMKAYVAIALQNDQLRQVIDVIVYTKTSLNEKPSDEAAN